MLLSDFYGEDKLYRNSPFERTMFPGSWLPFSICYAHKKSVINNINKNINISAVIVPPELTSFVNEKIGVVESNKPELSYFELHNCLVKNEAIELIEFPFISPSAQIAPSAIVSEKVIIEDGVEVSEGAIIGDNTVIGRNTFIGPNAIIGTRGMQNLKFDGMPYNVKFAGGVRIGESCEVLAQAVIQRPYQPFFTTIGNFTKVSVRASVGHGCQIGENSMIAGNVTIAGNVKAKNNLWVGPSSVIADGLEIGENVRILMGSVVVSNVSDGKCISGNFALNHNIHLKNHNKLRRTR